MVDLEMHLVDLVDLVDLDMEITDNTINNKIKPMMMKNRMRFKDIDICCYVK